MIQLKVEEIVEATKGELVGENKNNLIKGVCIDSRNVKKDELFIPLIGERFNGHDFINNAVNLGAGAILVSQWDEALAGYKDLPIIRVADTLKALQDISKYYISKFSIPIIGVTGSTGKTSTKDMIYSVLSKKYKVLKTQGNFNNHIGLPLTVFQLENDHEVAIFEMGMSGFGEIDTLAEIVRPHIGVITNIGLSHIERLGSQENILKAKMEITNYFNHQDVLIVNGDDPFLSTLRDEETSYKKYFVGLKENCDGYALNVRDLGLEGVTFDLILEKKSYPFELKVPGIHNVYNALSAISIGNSLNVPIEKIQEGVKDFKGSKMRLNISTVKEDIKVINDAYNASPDSMKAALSVLNRMEGNRKIAILADMLEMGEYAQKGHYGVGLEVAKQKVDILLTVGKEAENIAKGAVDGGLEKVFICKNNDEGINILKGLLQEEDVVLVKGSRGMRMEEIVDYLQERS